MKRITLFMAASVFLAVGATAMASDDSRISRAAIEAMFDQIKQQGTWDIEERCLWGYFFTGRDQSKLDAAGRLLQERGYRYVGIIYPDQQGENQTRLILHVERVEAHSVESLLTRNDEFYAFARQQGLESYDGMDVGPVRDRRCDPK